jgi:CheY-like chemotaxis protein
MSIALAMTFTAVRDARATAVLTFVRQIAALTEGAAADADVGLDQHGRFLVIRVKLAPVLVSAAILDRLQFWCARAGGLAAGAGSADMPVRCERLLGEASTVFRGVDATGMGAILGPLLIERCGAHPGSQEPEIPPVLRLQVGGPGWIGVTYDPDAHALFVPTPLAPAIGDALVVQLETAAPSRSVARAPARVVSAFVRDAAGAASGFNATLEGDFEAAHGILASACARSRPADCRRAAQRFPVSVPAGIGGPAATLADLSNSGAFIRTSAPGGVGDDVQVEVRLPNDATLQTTATVVHASATGMGVRFQLDPGASSALASAMTAITARRPHALVVDDDTLTLRLIADAFEQRGYDVVTAPDADFAMHALAEQILTLDLLVTDVLMPGVDGEQLVRRIRGIGGEGDLPIIAMSGRVDDALGARLRAAGADAVLAKSLGPEAIVQAANEVLVQQRAAPRVADAPWPNDAPVPLP